MICQSAGAAVAAVSYPGRVIIVGMDQTGTKGVIVYSIMGRSVNSRNRVFVKEGDGLRTEAHDPSLMTDPSLIIYRPVAVLGDTTIVTNGDQTDTIEQYLANGKTFADALRTREFENDAPNFTPRISAVLSRDGGRMRYRMSVLKSEDGTGKNCMRSFFEYENCERGYGHYIHTYQGDGSPLPSFNTEPERVLLTGGIDELTKEVWEGLNEDNRVSLFVRFIDIETGSYEDRVVNRNH